MTPNKTLHFNFLLEEEYRSSSPLRMRFIMPVLGVLCLLGPLVFWLQEFSQVSTNTSKKQVLQAEMASLKPSHEAYLKEKAEVKELNAQLQQMAFYRASKNLVGETLGNLANTVSSRIQLTRLELQTQTEPPLVGLQVRPKTVLDLVKLCPTNQTEAVKFRLMGRAVQTGGNPVEVNRFLQALQGSAFATLLDASIKPKVSFKEEASPATGRVGEAEQQEVVSFEIEYECLPRRFK
jgi:hypothetical protein